jgi:hypothetical protein
MTSPVAPVRLRLWYSFAVMITALFSGHGAEPSNAPLEKDSAAPRESHSRAAALNTYARLPLSFEANSGQTDSRVEFLARGDGYTVFLTPSEAILALRGSSVSNSQLPNSRLPNSQVPSSQLSKSQLPNSQLPTLRRPVDNGDALRIQLVGANRTVRGKGEHRLPGHVNYLTGRDRTRWRTGIPTYARVAYADAYPGIDLVYYGNQRRLEYDFIVRPGSDPDAITLAIGGADKIDIDEQGDLVLHVGSRQIRQLKPIVYQEANGVRREIEGRYDLHDSGRVKFHLAPYDPTLPVVIDPVLVYSTFVGGGRDDFGTGVAIDPEGNAYVSGYTFSSDFPTTIGAFDSSHNGMSDAFVTKLDATGATLLYSTFLGGSNSDLAQGVAVDATGNVYLAGYTDSSDFPVTLLAYDITYNGGFDAFVTKLDTKTGATLTYSTYLGGSFDDLGFGVAIDSSGSAYVIGRTSSSDFPTTAAGYDTSFNGNIDAFVTKLDPAGATLAYSTFLGGASSDFGQRIALDSSAHAYAIGTTSSSDFPTTAGAFDTSWNGNSDAFVTKLDPAGATLAYSTFLGGSNADIAWGVAVDAASSAYVTGFTLSDDFPTTAAAYDPAANGSLDAFVTKLDPAGATLAYSTFLGSSGDDLGIRVAIDPEANAYVTGYTSSVDFPTTADAHDSTYNGGFDVFVAKFDTTGATLVYSTFLGGAHFDAGFGLTVDASGNVYVTGYTFSSDFPTTAGAYDTSHNGGADVFVAKLGGAGAPAVLTLSPAADANPVDSQHCVTATVRDASGNPVPGIVVRFTVSGAVNTSGSATTDAAGEATFCYTGPSLPGEDAIMAFADTDNDGAQDAGEPGGDALKSWVPPETSPFCEITITNGGLITAANGDRATFGGNARVGDDGGAPGQEEYQDHGPAQRMNVKSIEVLAVVCDPGANEASMYGVATVDGSGRFFYRVKVRDVAEPGAGHDTYWIVLQNGYTSGEQVLEGGNVQVRRQ